MNTTTMIVALCIALVLIALIIVFVRQRKSDRLKTKFGSEYSRAVEESGGRGKGEAGLLEREKRVEGFSIKPLSAIDRDFYADSWRRIQAEFVDDPNRAVTEADELLGKVMSTRGYPVGDFDQRAADISVDHPVVVENYRTAHEIAVRHAGGQASTEDLRQAMIHYRTLFDELVVEPQADGAKAAA
jgi:hypothetical protein